MGQLEFDEGSGAVYWVEKGSNLIHLMLLDGTLSQETVISVPDGSAVSVSYFSNMRQECCFSCANTFFRTSYPIIDYIICETCDINPCNCFLLST